MRKKKRRSDKRPCPLRGYWPDYQIAHARRDQRRAKAEPTFQRAVNDVAFAMLQALRLVHGQRATGARGSHHRRVLELLGGEAARDYKRLLARLLVQETPLDAEAHARLAYVAMPRPTHLLAPALRSSDLGEDPARDQRTRELNAQSWRIVDLTTQAQKPEVPLEEEAPCLP